MVDWYDRNSQSIYQTRAEIRQAVFDYIEVYYNRERLQSAAVYIDFPLPAHCNKKGRIILQ